MRKSNIPIATHQQLRGKSKQSIVMDDGKFMDTTIKKGDGVYHPKLKQCGFVTEDHTGLSDFPLTVLYPGDPELTTHCNPDVFRKLHTSHGFYIPKVGDITPKDKTKLAFYGIVGVFNHQFALTEYYTDKDPRFPTEGPEAQETEVRQMMKDFSTNHLKETRDVVRKAHEDLAGKSFEELSRPVTDGPDSAIDISHNTATGVKHWIPIASTYILKRDKRSAPTEKLAVQLTEQNEHQVIEKLGSCVVRELSGKLVVHGRSCSYTFSKGDYLLINVHPDTNNIYYGVLSESEFNNIYSLPGIESNPKGNFNFVKFTEAQSPVAMPKNMKVGQIVVRKECASGYRSNLKRMMKECHKDGWTFSIDETPEYLAIRRDS